MVGGSTISQCGLSVLHWQRPGLTLHRGGVYKADRLPLVGDEIQNGALHKLESALRLDSRFRLG